MLRFTPKFCYQTSDDKTHKDRYDVVAEDDDSITLRCCSDQFVKTLDPLVLEGLEYALFDPESLFAPKLLRFHFERFRGQDFFWIDYGGLCEWFKKQRPTSRWRRTRCPAGS